MLKVTYGNIDQSRERTLDHISTQRATNPNFRVIDIGGVAGGGWTAGVADMIVDIQSLDSEHSMALDICNHHDWHRLLDLVDKQGMYDYAICSHTLEDIYDPVMALKWLPKIARAGIITMPSIRTELCRLTPQSPGLGFIHHRWLFDQKDGEMLIVPKLVCLEHVLGPGFQYNHAVFEIQYEWQGSIPYKMFMNNYLGPNEQTVLDEFRSVVYNVKI